MLILASSGVRSLELNSGAVTVLAAALALVHCSPL